MLTGSRSKTRKFGAGPGRDPGRTRRRLLDAGFQEVYERGYQGADLDAVLERAGVTKGALYYHFANKEALGHAIIEEVIGKLTQKKWVAPLASGNPIDTLIHIVESTSTETPEIRGGCPFNNLSQEMSPLDEGFRKRLAKILTDWRNSMAEAFRRGQHEGTVKKNIEPDDEATYVIAIYEGYISLAKNSQDAKLLKSGKKRMMSHLESLRA
jgi:TetR/AcrR family transcriptional regulator, transcriptional repressor for nem operon